MPGLSVGNPPCQGTDLFTPDPVICQPPFTSYPPPPLPEGEGEMTSPQAHSTWAGAVKGQPPPAVSPGPSPPPSVQLCQLYKDCEARGTWARLIFETKGGEEELSFSCRVQAGAATTKAANKATAAPRASKKHGKKRPANERRRERARRREDGLQRVFLPQEEQQPSLQQLEKVGTVATVRSNSHWQEQRQEHQLLAGVAAVGRSGSLMLGAAALDRSSSHRKKQQQSTGVAAAAGAADLSKSSSCRQEQQTQELWRQGLPLQHQ